MPSPPITLVEFVSIAALILGVDEVALWPAVRTGPAESALAAPYAEFGGHVQYPDPIHRAAIACSRIVRNHPLPDGNKRAGFIVMTMMLSDLGLTLSYDAPEPVAEVIQSLAAGTLPESGFIAWVSSSVTPDRTKTDG